MLTQQSLAMHAMLTPKPHTSCLAAHWLLQGDALYAAEVALSLEKLNFQKLRDLHTVSGGACCTSLLLGMKQG